MPTLVRAAGADAADLGFAGIDGVDQWSQLTGGEDPPPRHEILHNIDPKNGYQSAIRVGDFKLLLGNPGGPDKWCDVCNFTTGCNDTSGGAPKLVKSGGMVCEASIDERAPEALLFNIADDPREQRDLSAEQPEVLQRLLARLQSYNSSAVPVCFPAADRDELARPPVDGFWGAFHDQSDPADASCALLRHDFGALTV